MPYPTWALIRPLDVPTLRGKVVELRPVSGEHAGAIRAAGAVPDIARGFGVPPATDERLGVAYIEMLDRLRSAGIALPFMVYDAHGNVAGHVGVTLRDINHGRVTLGYWTFPQFRGKGVTSDAVRTVTEWLLQQDGVHRITLHIETWNAASVSVAEAAGYTYETTLKRWEIIAGEPRDMLIYTRFR